MYTINRYKNIPLRLTAQEIKKLFGLFFLPSSVSEAKDRNTSRKAFLFGYRWQTPLSKG
jgi:RNA recognition motif-containing protein